MTLSLDCYKCRLLLTVSLILLPEALRAQNICGKVAAGLLCLDQPYEAQTQVTGRVKAGPSVPGAAVMITVNVATPQAATVNADGTFILKKLPALNHFDIVKADQTMPPPDGGGPPPSTGPISVLPAPVTCANVAAGALCLDQPYEGQAKVTGKVIQTAGAPVAGAEVLITVNNAAPQKATVNGDGTFILTGLPALNHFNTVQADQTMPPPDGGGPPPSTGPVAVLPPANVSNEASPASSFFTLGLAGINVTGSSTSGPSQQYFAELDLIAPLQWLPFGCSNNETYFLSRRCWVWLNPRIASVPTTSSTALSSFNSSSLITGIGTQTIGGISQSFEFQAGGEYYVFRPSKPWGAGSSWTKGGVSLIFGVGALTPFNSISTAPEYGLNSNLAQQFTQNAALATQYPQLAGALCSGYGYMGSTNFTCPPPPSTKPTTVAFVFPNRSRFYRSFFGGFRLRFFFFKGTCGDGKGSGDCQVASIYPGTFDIRFGEDESVTGGHLVPLVTTLTGSQPIPGTKGAVRVFGSAYLRLSGNQNSPALVLVPTTSFLSLDNAQVAVQPIPRSDLDYFRLGLGVDLIALIRDFNSNKPPAKQAGQ